MEYVLTGIPGGNLYKCSEDFWIEVLALAKSRDWEPEGTSIDLISALDDAWDDMQGYDVNMLSMATVNMKSVDWDSGNYTDREGQMVSESDAYNLYLALEGLGIDEDLLVFLKSNAFTIR